MKNIYFIIFILISGQLIAQDCNQLFISEIVFGKIQTLTGSTILNHSIEIYNPRKESINLTEYSLTLFADDETNESIQLAGIIPVEEVYVISNSLAETSITSVSNTVDNKINFEGKVALELAHNGEVID